MHFPAITIVGGSLHAVHLRHAGDRLGLGAGRDLIIDLDDRSVIALRASVTEQVSETVVLAARSAHGQAATWMPTSVMIESDEGSGLTVTPAVHEDLGDPELLARIQRAALTLVGEHECIGVVEVAFDQDLRPIELRSGPNRSWWWTLDGALTDAYEQHLRALLNLPLGSSQMTTGAAVTMPIIVGTDDNMYYPYLHLFARDPGLRVYQQSQIGAMGDVVGHVAVVGTDRNELIARAEHAALYFMGAIDE